MNSLLSAISTVHPVILFVIGTLTIIAGDTYAKLWSTTGFSFNASMSMLFYVVGGLIFIAIVKATHSVGISNVIWSLLGIMGTLIVSYFFFHEAFNLKQALGIILGILSIILITQ